MTEENPPSPQPNPDQPPPPVLPIIKEEDDIEKDGDQSSPPAKAACEIKHEWPNVIVNVQKEEPPQNRTANILTLVYVILTAGILFATYRILQATRDSVKVAQDALADNREKDSLQRISDSASGVKQDSIFRVRLQLDSQTAVEQIKAMRGTLAETKNEFAIENRPYLQITHPRMDTFAIGRPMKIKFNIENLGGYPAKILAYKMYANGNTQPTTDEEIKRIDGVLNKFDNSRFLLNRYIIRGTPLETEYSDTVGFTETQYNLVKTTKQIMYFVGYFRYQNLITKQERIYKYRIEIECKLGGFADFKYNENEDLSNKEAKRVIPLENWK